MNHFARTHRADAGTPTPAAATDIPLSVAASRPQRKEAYAASGSTADPSPIFRVGESGASRSDALSVCQQRKPSPIPTATSLSSSSKPPAWRNSPGAV